MAIVPAKELPLVDPATGRLRMPSDEERRARSARLRRTLEDIAKITDATDTDRNWAEVFRGLDAARPEPPPTGPPDPGDGTRQAHLPPTGRGPAPGAP